MNLSELKIGASVPPTVQCAFVGALKPALKRVEELNRDLAGFLRQVLRGEPIAGFACIV